MRRINLCLAFLKLFFIKGDLFVRYFSYLEDDEEKRLFHKIPKEFNKNKDKKFLQYALGGHIYVPAIRKDMIYKCLKGKIKGLTSFTICLEDAIGINGEGESIENLAQVLKEVQLRRDKKDIPLIFIRPRNLEQMLKFKDILEENKDIITGIVIPKEKKKKIDSFIEGLEKINCLKLYIMPIIESIEFIDYTLKDKYLKDLKRAVLEHRDKILNIRVGVTDILGSYGIRRDKSLTIYDNIVFKNLTFDLMSILKNDEIDIPISGGVSEVYDMNKKDILNTFIKEVKIDKLNGFIGKTVIHPFQMNVVQAMNVISYEDYMDAKSILDGVGSKYSISGSINCERMNEVNPHTKWAKKIMLLSDIYGVFNKGISFNELFRF